MLNEAWFAVLTMNQGLTPLTGISYSMHAILKQMCLSNIISSELSSTQGDLFNPLKEPADSSVYSRITWVPTAMTPGNDPS